MTMLINKYEDALDVLFDKITAACKAVGLDLKADYYFFYSTEDPEVDVDRYWTVGIWIEGSPYVESMVTIYGELNPSYDNYHKLLKWAHIKEV